MGREDFSNIFSIGQSMSYPLCQGCCMKTYSRRYNRPSLFTLPYSVRQDRCERGLRILRALRLSLAASNPPPNRPQQREFEFALPKRA